MDAADDSADQSTDSLDNLATFLMHHAYQSAVTDAERLQIFAVVDAYQEGDEPSTIESVMRTMALRFCDHSDYRPEWHPRPASGKAVDRQSQRRVAEGDTRSFSPSKNPAVMFTPKPPANCAGETSCSSGGVVSLLPVGQGL